MKNHFNYIFYFFCLISVSCGSINEQVVELDKVIEPSEDTSSTNGNNTTNSKKDFKILALGDSYTIGESVCATCRFPVQLKDSLLSKVELDTTFSLKIIAQTGWTTNNLIAAIENENITNDYDIVTLLIGVNNQYQGLNFSTYESEFPTLVNTSIKAVKGNKNKLVVVSIPDYAFTSFGKGNTTISEEIDKYNRFAEDYCKNNDITFVNITDITRQGLANTALVANDGLHPSKLAYSKFVERILPFALKEIKN